nr:hypothetical protein HK105_003987 [Polyrhizophydium stewartii]
MLTEATDLDCGWWPDGDGIGTDGSIADEGRRRAIPEPGARAGAAASSADGSEPPAIERPSEYGQVLYGLGVTGSLIAVLRLRPDVFVVLSLLQEAMDKVQETQPLLGNKHARFRSQSFPMLDAIDGDFVCRFTTSSGSARERVMAEWNRLRMSRVSRTDRRGSVPAEMTAEQMDRILHWIDGACV